MTASIGGYSFITLRGAVNPGTGEQVEEITRPGVHGVAYRQLGAMGLSFPMMSTVDCEDAAEVQTLINGYKSLQGYLSDMTDDVGNDWYNIMVLNVQPRQIIGVAGASGGFHGASARYLLVCDWTLQATEY